MVVTWILLVAGAVVWSGIALIALTFLAMARASLGRCDFHGRRVALLGLYCCLFGMAVLLVQGAHVAAIAAQQPAAPAHAEAP